MSIKSIDPEEAARVKKMIVDQSGVAKDAIKKVMDTPNQLTSFKGNLANNFRSETQADMKKLTTAMQAVDRAADSLQKAIQRFVDADRG